MVTDLLTALSDVSVIIFDLLIYAQLIEFRKDTPLRRRLVYGGCGVIVVAYLLGTYVYGIPASTSMVMFMTAPSLLIFFLVSKYRDARFFLTFCFVDTVTLALAFFSRLTGIGFGAPGQVVGVALLMMVFIGIYRFGKPHFRRYRQLMEYTRTGWLAMMLSSAIIYVMLVALAAHPKPLMERKEYLPTYTLVCIAVLAHYTVVLIFIAKNKKLYDQRCQMERQQKWYRIAYWDVLTGVPNRASYMEYANELSHRYADDPQHQVSLSIIDLNDFKRINDQYGHTRGDEVLRDFAQKLTQVFFDEENRVFRIGGDEFAVVSVGVGEDALARRFGELRAACREICDFSMGCCEVKGDENNAFEKAFERADHRMYEDKRARMAQ